MKRRSFPSRHAEPRMSLDNDAEAVVAGPPATTVRSARAATPNQVLAIVCVATCLANLDLFVVNVGLPNIARDFRGASLEDLSWILNGYAIAYAALLVFFCLCRSAGVLRSAGRAPSARSELSASVVLFTGASAACAMARNVETLVVFRVIQAAGA